MTPINLIELVCTSNNQLDAYPLALNNSDSLFAFITAEKQCEGLSESEIQTLCEATIAYVPTYAALNNCNTVTVHFTDETNNGKLVVEINGRTIVTPIDTYNEQVLEMTVLEMISTITNVVYFEAIA